MFGDVTFIQDMTGYVTDSVGLLSSCLGVAIFRIVRMSDEIANDARMPLREVNVADGLDLGRRTAGGVFRIIAVFGHVAQQFRMRRNVADRLFVRRGAASSEIGVIRVMGIVA